MLRAGRKLVCAVGLLALGAVIPLPAPAQDDGEAGVRSTVAAPQNTAATAIEAAIDKGRRLLRDGRLDEAQGVLETLVEQASSDAHARFWLGRLYMRRGRQDDALREIEQSITLAPDDLDLRLELAKAYEEADRYEAAERTYRSILGEDTGHLDARLHLGRLYMRTDRLEPAIQVFEDIAGRTRDPVRIREVQGRLVRLYESKATSIVEALARGEPDTASAVEFGKKLQRNRRLDDAERVLEAVIELEPENAQAHYWLGQVYLDRKQYGEGVAGIELSLSLAPENLDLKHELAKAYERAGELEDAERTYQEIVDEAEDPQLRQRVARHLGLIRGRRHMETGDADAAVEVYDALLAMDPGDRQVLWLKAYALNVQGEHGASDRILAELLSLAPDNVRLRMRIASIYESRGDDSRAREQYAHVVELDPDEEVKRQALNALGLEEGVRLAREEAFDQALDAFERVRAVAPTDPEVNLNMGKIYHRQERFEEAEAAYRTVLERVPEHAPTWWELGLLLMQTDRPGDAIDALEKVVDYGRSTTLAQQAQRQLTRLYQVEVKRVADALTIGEGDTESALALGKRLVQTQQFNLARQLLSALVARAPEDPQAHYWLGQARITLGEADKGLSDIERSVELAPDNMSLLRELGRAYERTDQWEKAEQVYKTLAERAEDEALVREAERRRGVARGRRFAQSGDFTAALKEYETLLEITPEDIDLMAQRAGMLLALGRDAEAEDAFDGVLETAPDDMTARLTIAQVYERHEYLTEAAAFYKGALELAPSNHTVRLTLGGIYERLERFDEAMQQYGLIVASGVRGGLGSKARNRMQETRKQLIARGRELLANDKLDEAQELFEAVLENEPDNAQGHFWLSRVFKARESYRDEVESIEKSLELAGGNTRLKRLLAFAYINAAMLTKAEQTLKELLEEAPYDSEVRFRLAELYDKRGEEQRARAELIELLELQSPEEWTQKALDMLGLEEGRHLIREKQYEQALEVLEEVRDVAPQEPEVARMVADVYRELGRVDEAEAAYQKALQMDPQEPGTRIGLAELYSETDREDQAVEELHRVVSEHEGSREATRAQQRIEILLAGKAEREISEAAELETPRRIEEKLLPVGIEMIELGGLGAAQAVLEFLLTEAPDSAAAHYWLGQVYTERGSHADGLVLIKKATALAPGELAYWMGLGEVYRDAGLNEQAEEAMLEAVALEPGYHEARLELADLYEHRGDPQRAREQYAQVLTKDPDEKVRQRALNGLGLEEGARLVKDEKLDEALRLFERILAVVPDEPLVNLQAANIYHLQKRYGRAEAAYRKASTGVQVGAKAWLGLGLLYSEMDRTDEAIDALNEVVTRAEGTPEARQAQRRLTGLYERSAERVAAALERGDGDAEAAVELGQRLVRAGRMDSARDVLTALAARAPDNPRAFYWLGQAHIALGEIEQGLGEIEHSVALAPENMRLRLTLGEAYQRIGRLQEAERVYAQVAERAQDEAVIRDANRRLGFVQGRRFAAAGNLEAALARYDALLEDYPEDLSLLGARGEMLVALGRDEEADELFERVLELAPENMEARMSLVKLYARRDETDKFLEQLRAIIAIDPRSDEARQARERLGYDRGVELLGRKALDDAEQVFDRLLTVTPDDPLTNFQLGRVYFEQGRWRAAERAFKKTVAIDPSHQRAHYNLGRLYKRFQNEELAINAFEQVVAIGEDTEVVGKALDELDIFYRQQAARYQQAGEIERAIRSLRRAVDANPENVAARYSIASLYARLGQDDQALSEFKKVVELAPDNANGYQNVAVMHARQGQYAEAIENYAQSIALETDEEAARAKVRALVLAQARQLIGHDRPIGALRALEDLNAAGLGDARTYQMVAQMYTEQGDLEQATQVYRDAIRVEPDEARLRLNLAVLYERTNEDQLALYQYREIMNVSEPGSTIAEQARMRMERVEQRLRLFSSSMQYSLTTGESVIEEQDIVNTGAVNSSFSSIFSYSLATRFRPREDLLLTFDTGLRYIGNHSTQNDSIVPSIGFSGRYNTPDFNINGSIQARHTRSLLLDTLSAPAYNMNIGGTMRLTDPLDLLRNLGGADEEPETGETRVERAPERTAARGARPENARLRSALERVYESLYPATKQIVIPEEEGQTKRHVVKKGDTLWEIAEALLLDPFLWPEIWEQNPQIDNPHLINPGDVITLFYIGERPVIVIERAGERLAPPAESVELTPEEMARRTEQIEHSLEEGIDLYEKGRDLLLQGRLAEALEMFNLVLDIVPDDPLTNLQAGIVHHRQQEFLLARDAYTRALSADPENMEVRLQLGVLYTDMGRLDDAVAAFESVMHEGADTDDAREAQGRLTELYERRARSLLEHPELHVKALGELGALGQKLRELGALDAAQSVLEALLARAPDYAQGHIEMARLHIDRGESTKAVRHARAGVELAPGRAEYRRLLARAYQEAGRLREAAAAYGEVLAVTEGGAARAAVQRALSLVEARGALEAGEFAGALEICRAVLERHPEDLPAWEVGARAYVHLGELENAAEFYEKAITLRPDDLNLHLHLAEVYGKLGRDEASDQQLAKALNLAGSDIERRAALDALGFQRGIELLRAGRLEEALEKLEQIRTVAPDDPLVKLNIGVIQQRQGQSAEAEAVFQEILEADPRNLTAMLRLGLLYAETRRVAKAITTLEKIVLQGEGTEAGQVAARELEELEQQRLEKLRSGELEEAEPVPKSLRAALFFNDSSPRRVSIAETRGYGINLAFNYPSLEWGNWRLGYRYTVRDNEHPFGTDYAYRSHGVNLNASRAVPNLFGWFGDQRNIPGLAGFFALSKEWRNYVAPDTNALNALGRSEHRQVTIDSLTFGMSYRLHNKMTVSAQWNNGRNRSNLPIGLVYDPAGVQPVAAQSAGLGDFSQQSFTLGLGFNF